MKITKLWLQNYRSFERFDCEFQPDINVVVGGNGSGKSSLLKGIAEVLVGCVENSMNHVAALSDPSSTRVAVTEHQGRYRFDPQVPVAVKARGDFGGEVCEWGFTKDQASGHATLIGQYPFTLNAARADAAGHITLPIIAFYRANRHWPNSASQQAFTEGLTKREARGNGYAHWDKASDDVASLTAWVIAKCLERYQISSEVGTKFNDFVDDELALAGGAIGNVIQDIVGLRYDISRKGLLVEWASRVHHPNGFSEFDNMSDGQKAVIALLADIARRMCLLNPQHGAETLALTPGVVLIDELDLHLHPTWQRLIINGLGKAFPKVQFIVATHSPQIIGELKSGQIMVLNRINSEGTTASQSPAVSYGLDSAEVLEVIMESPPRAERVRTALSEIFQKLEVANLEAATELLQELKSIAPGIPEIGKAEALLKRKRVVGR